MLNIGPLELLVVLAVALIVVGPERLPDLARSIGKGLRQLRQVQDDVRDMVSMGIDDDVRQAATDFKKATGDLTKVTDVKGAARKAGRTARTGVRRSLEAGPTTAATGGSDVATPAVTPETTPVDGPAAPDAPTAPDGSAIVPGSDGEGPPADRLVEDRAAIDEDRVDRP